MAGQDDDDRTEEPSQRKLDQAREKGDIIYSAEVGAALSLLAATAIVAYLSGPIAVNIGRDFLTFLEAPEQFSTEPAALRAIAQAVVTKALLAFGLASVALALAGLAARYVQDKPTFTAERLNPRVDKLSPIEGFKRVFGKAAFAAFLKSLAKFVVVGAAMAYALWPHDAELQLISLLDPAALLPFVRDKAVSMLIALTSAAALLAALDYVFTRQSYMKRQRMSRREIKEEHRQSEGDPMVKAKLRQIRMDRQRKRMMAAVPTASVVITNPTHYAIALRYEQGETAAPICVAKGVDDVALRIRALAEEHNIPIHEDPPLARALFSTVDVEEAIPREHYEAVAKIIGVVMRLAQRRRRALRPGDRPL
jgi:flagellar biosynthetic protein FlhB